MQLASYGARVLSRKGPQTARSIHIPSAIRPQSAGLGQKLLTQTRLALTRFVTHLTTPGTGTVSVARSFHAANPSIQQRLSFTARTTLARPLQPHFLPRPPVVPRTMMQVGLGTARNFSSGRPIFQQLADNIPVAGRAFYEADWEVNMHKERQKISRPSKKAAIAKASKELLKPAAKPKAAAATSTETEAEIEHYFPAPSVPDVTTYLLVPLAPTPTSRAPLPEFPMGRLALPAVLAIHDTHETHQLRVSSLFHRLDTANVWSRGVVCEAYATSADAHGVCNILKVEFAGWSKAEVRSVIGESGTGWCVLEEVHGAVLSDEEDAFSETSSILSGIAGDEPRVETPPVAMDPAQSFVLPTLDFSSTFLEASAHSRSPTPASESDIDVFSYTHSNGSAESDLWSDHEPVFVDPPSENGWFESRMELEDPWLSDGSGWQVGFSSDFSQRLGPTPEPIESAFA
ncbi:hypothetical protein R3P38DRAFT_2843095 [Favolaschia claudopus]|uniref:Uncharacterized protein n=1 Tax=Favolaschia claudopus TaxID=2862362 RepID=A0AAW0E0Y0_9AGAR